MPSQIARIEVYPEYNEDGSMDLDLPFSYGCPDLDLMGYTDILLLVEDLREELKK